MTKLMIEDRLLSQVTKPARYTGGELNSVVKEKNDITIRFAFCFPDAYEIGMSHLGMKILYHLLNERNDTWCERVFAPWMDLEEIMRAKSIPLFGLESQEPITHFDFLGFTLQYEMSYTNILNMIDLAGIPLKSEERLNGDWPFVCAGGPCAVNPEPLAPFVDFYMIGEGEEIINEVMDVYLKWKQSGESRIDFLLTVSQIEGIYVPMFYVADYQADGRLNSFGPKAEYSGKVPVKIKKRIINDMDKVIYPDKLVVPFLDIVHDRIMLELFRGCIRGCRFCQAGFIYRPVREKSPERLMDLARSLVDNTGYEEVGLTSLSTSDFTGLKPLVDPLLNEMEERKVSFSLPSLRIDSFSMDIMEKAQKVRKSGLTFAPEAGTQRLRDVINKGVTEEDLIRSAKMSFEGGWTSVKLYFMMGLPTETMEDIEGIADLSRKVVKTWYSVPRELRKKALSLSVSASAFVPKPFTPFQWEPQDTMDTLKEKQWHLKDKIKDRAISYRYHDSSLSYLEAVFSRGDRRVAEVLELVWKKGCRFDSWDEFFKFDVWMKTFEEAGIDPAFYANRKREFDELLPWDHIDIGVSKGYLIKEAKRAYNAEITPDCRSNCEGCGAVSLTKDACVCTEV